MYRQGDLLFKKIDKLPGGVTPSRDNVILRGEVTGHAHILQNGQIFHKLGFYQHVQPEIFIEVENNGRVVHLDETLKPTKEHDPLELPQGFYQVIRQREYSPWGMSNVQD